MQSVQCCAHRPICTRKPLTAHSRRSRRPCRKLPCATNGMHTLPVAKSGCSPTQARELELSHAWTACARAPRTSRVEGAPCAHAPLPCIVPCSGPAVAGLRAAGGCFRLPAERAVQPGERRVPQRRLWCHRLAAAQAQGPRRRAAADHADRCGGERGREGGIAMARHGHGHGRRT